MKCIQSYSFLFLVVLLTSCYTHQKSRVGGRYSFDGQGNGAGFEKRVVAKSETYDADAADAEKVEFVKKIIYEASYNLTVKNPDSTNAQLENIAKRYGGYVTQLSTTRSVIRVKNGGMKNALLDVESLGRVQSKNVSGQDVTNQYLDYQIRLENAEKARVRYLQLLEKAENVEAALLVEKELERLNGTIDMLKGNMSRIDHLAEFSTITVRLIEKKKPGVLGYIGIGIYRSVKWLFVRN